MATGVVATGVVATGVNNKINFIVFINNAYF